MVDNGGMAPTPDPTTLTTDAIQKANDHTDREIRHLKELQELALADLKELMLTMFADNKTAVDAALDAAEKANGKTESNFAALIKQQEVTNAEIAKGLGDRITQAETRIAKTEAAVGA